MQNRDNNRRRHTRFAGPFDGWRVGLIDTPLRFFDLSRGGCFVDSMHEQASGSRLALKIMLPEVGALTLTGETLYERGGFGFAVRFVDVDPETALLLDRALEALQRQATPARRQVLASAARVSAPADSIATVAPPAPVLLAASFAATREPQFVAPAAPLRRARESRVERPRDSRLPMLGSGYRVSIDDQPVTLVNLSLSGVQVRGAVRLSLGQPAIVKIGWLPEQPSFTAIARVRWVQPDAARWDREPLHRIGLAFETWDVRRLREIIGARRVPTRTTMAAAAAW